MSGEVPAYNHTRGDSPRTPCPKCKALLGRQRTAVAKLEARRDAAYERAYNAREETICDLFNGFTDALRESVNVYFDELDRADRNHERALRRRARRPR